MEEAKKPTAREAMLAAIQQYAEEWKEGKSTLSSPAKTAVYLAMDNFEEEAAAKGTERVLKKLCGFIGGEVRTSDYHQVDLVRLLLEKIAVMQREAEVRSCRG
jgi:hypothetical protein